MRFMIISFLGMGCALSLEEKHDWDDDVSDSAVVEDTGVEEPDDGLFRVNATDYESWIYVDLETEEQLTISDAQTDMTWDMGILRYKFKLNSGIHGSSVVEAIVVEDIEYESLTEAPAGEYIVDQPDDDEDTIPEYALEEWFDYDISTHILTPKESFYVIRNRNDVYFKFRIHDYYDSAGTPAMLTLEWEEILPPAE